MDNGRLQEGCKDKKGARARRRGGPARGIGGEQSKPLGLVRTVWRGGDTHMRVTGRKA